MNDRPHKRNKTVDAILAEARGRFLKRVTRQPDRGVADSGKGANAMAIVGRHREDPLRANPRTLDAIGTVIEASYEESESRFRSRLVIKASGITMTLDSNHPAAPYETNLIDGVDLIGRRVHISGVPLKTEANTIELSMAVLLAIDPMGEDIVSFDILEWDGDSAICGAIAFDAVGAECVNATILRAVASSNGVVLIP
jgi:hypothetical protein